MCGVIGMLGQSAVNQSIYDALTIIQHRGQDAAGIVTCDTRRVHLRKSNGLVRDAIRERHMLRLKGNMGIGHVRYPTAGSESAAESQPFYVNSPYGLSIVHNGTLVNAAELADDLQRTDLRHLNTESDSEVLLNVLAYELQRVGGTRLAVESLFQAVTALYKRVNGAFSAVAMINGYGILAFRDPYGIRPLVYGRRWVGDKAEYMIASETIALDALGFKEVADVGPGEAIFIDLQGQLHRQQCVPVSSHSPCLFEFIYMARPDSVIDNIPVYKARLAMGEHLARSFLQQYSADDIDVVIPIPDTSRTSALALAQVLNIKFIEGFVKNRYIGRTFIMPGQEVRRSSVRLKLNAIKDEFAGKNVLLVDDSIVRGTTSREIIQMARDAGAKKVYFASAAPEVRYANVYGIDMPSREELVAYNRTVEEISTVIGADGLIYQTLADVVLAVNSAVKKSADRIQRFEDSIFTGDYITGGVDSTYLASLAKLRSDDAKKRRQSDTVLSDQCGVYFSEELDDG